MTIPNPLDDVSSGKMPAVSLPPIQNHETTPQAEFVVTNFHNLDKFNLAYHEFPSDGLSVIYNQKLTDVKKLDEAKAKNDLFQIAPLVGAPDPRTASEAPPDNAQNAAPSQALAPSTGNNVPVTPQAPPVPVGALASAHVPVNKKAQSASLLNAKQMQPKINQPNPVNEQLARRAV